MLIGNKIFPYPLLRDRDNNTDYKNTQFYFKFDTENGMPIIKNEHWVLSNIYFFLDNLELKKVYEEGAIKVICEVDCSATVYREFFELTEEPQTKEIPITNFVNNVTISAYLVATREITDFTSNDFVDDFKGYKFHFYPSNVLAAHDGFKLRMDIDKINDNKISSIFTIIKKDDAKSIITYNNEINKISIYLGPDTYDIYNTMKNHSKYNNVFFASIVTPILSSCLQEIQNGFCESDLLEDICDDNQWFKSVMKRYELVKGKVLEAEEFRSINCYELAQMLMNESTDKSIKDFYHLVINGEELCDDE